MTNNIKLPCGLDKDGNTVYIENAIRGRNCACFCPGCKQPLEARKGQKNAHHFAHVRNDFDCKHGFQSALHYMMKDLFLEIQYFIFIKNGREIKYQIDSVVLENKIDCIIPDIIIISGGKHFIVEIFVTHALDDKKKQIIKELQISALEINMSKFQHKSIDKELLKKEIFNSNNFSWIYDADYDLIDQKKQIIQNFGLKIPIQKIGNAVNCPLLLRQNDKFCRFIPLQFCLHCHNCVWDGQSDHIMCGYVLPITVHPNGRRTDIFVNDKKVLFKNEESQYKNLFTKKLLNAVRMQYRIFQRISVTLCMNNSYIISKKKKY